MRKGAPPAGYAVARSSEKLTLRPQSSGPGKVSRSAGAGLFALTIFLGSFLLFQVQPLIGKFILPWFGGGPGVWTTCMLFFQVCLLAGYAYAHLISRLFSNRAQVVLHVTLLLAALAFLPIVPGEHWKPAADAAPAWRILLLMTACLGLPYFLLAATGPLLQAWFSRLRSDAAPYRLYALSNAGSLLALVSYPFVFEPAFARRTQAVLWAWSFGIFALLCSACARRLWRARPEDAIAIKRNAKSSAQSPAPTPPSAAIKASWFGLPACASILLLAATNKLCLDVAAIPFLWMAPLSLYLLTFIICFDRPAWYSRKAFTLLLVPLLAGLCYTLSSDSTILWRLQAVVLGGSLFVGCMICHGEVYRLRPAPQFLTSFYLLIAAGGAAGALFVSVVAPLLFHSYAELSWGAWLLAALVFCIHLRERTQMPLPGRRWPLWPVTLAGVALLGAALLFQAHVEARDTLLMSRNFYGVLRVIEASKDTPYHAYKLNHGRTTHGLQFADPALQPVLTTYYNEPSGVGVALNNFPRRTNRRVGIVGLGTGTLAAYGRPGDTFRFYEIDPAVRQLAETRFTFLRNSQARIEVVHGDARLSLERESEPPFDLLVLDAFTSDAIPIHLLTLEAFTTYFNHLKPDGAIVVHISNRHLNLLRVLVGTARESRLMMVGIAWSPPSSTWWCSTSEWIILSHNASFMRSPAVLSHAARLPEGFADRPIFWTDDYASLFSILEY